MYDILTDVEIINHSDVCGVGLFTNGDADSSRIRISYRNNPSISKAAFSDIHLKPLFENPPHIVHNEDKATVMHISGLIAGKTQKLVLSAFPISAKKFLLCLQILLLLTKSSFGYTWRQVVAMH